MQAIATDPDGAGPAPPNFYNHPNPTSLNQVFTQIAMDLAASRGRLIDNTNPNLIGRAGLRWSRASQWHAMTDRA